MCNKASTPGDREARKKTVSLLFEREIADWLEEVGGLSRKHFLTEEEQEQVGTPWHLGEPSVP